MQVPPQLKLLAKLTAAPLLERFRLQPWKDVFGKAWKGQSSTFKRQVYADTATSHLMSPMLSLSIYAHSLKSYPYSTLERLKQWLPIQFRHFSQLAMLGNQSVSSSSLSYSLALDLQTTGHMSSHQSNRRSQKKTCHLSLSRTQSCR